MNGTVDVETKRAKPKLLVIPHMYAENIRVREIELAKRLASQFEVYCWKWPDALLVNDSSMMRRRAKQFRRGSQALFQKRRIENGPEGMYLLEAPVVQPVLLRRLLGDEWAWRAARKVNRATLERVVSELGITHLLLASGKFFLPRSRAVRVYFDQVDWYAEERATSWQRKFTQEYFRHLAGRADGVFAVSDLLCEKLQRDYALGAVCLPNGADLKAMRNLAPARIRAVLDRWGLRDSFVIGYIGNHGSAAGIDFLLDTFRAVRERIPSAALLIVGPADYWLGDGRASGMPGVIFTGAVPPDEIGAYFNALDLAVLAQKKSLETEYAFQIKVVEYSACRKFVISTPLAVWQRLNWPNVSLVEPEVGAWVAAILRLMGSRWSPDWDRIVDAYDWEVLAQRAAEVMLRPDNSEKR